MVCACLLQGGANDKRGVRAPVYVEYGDAPLRICFSVFFLGWSSDTVFRRLEMMSLSGD